MLRASLFGLVCLATLIALFYAVENWRGRWAWNRFKREMEAKSEKFDWQAFVPPAVPDDQNFAMTPLLKPVLDYEPRAQSWPHYSETHWRDTNGFKRLQYLGLQRAGLNTNQPSSFSEWRKGKRIDLAAWQAYFRWTPPPSWRQTASPVVTNEFPIAAQPQTPELDVLLALSRFDAEFAELHTASARPHARFPVHYGEGLGTLLPHLATMKKLSQMATLRAVAELEAGQDEQAFRDVKLSFHTADALRAEPFFISHLVRLAIMGQSMQGGWEGLAAHRWSSNQLASLMNYLKTVDLLADYTRVVRSERSLGGFVSTFSERKQRRELLENMFGSQGIRPEFILILDYYPQGWFYLNDLSAARFYQEKVLPLISPTEQRAYPTQARTVIREFEDAPARPGNAILKYFGLFIAPQPFARGQTDINLARVACALERYWQAHQQYPETLAAVIPAYLDKLPTDIITGQPLKYRRTESGQFVLYSVGWDEADDGGQFPIEVERPSERMRMRDWANHVEEKGDWVWRYSSDWE